MASLRLIGVNLLTRNGGLAGGMLTVSHRFRSGCEARNVDRRLCVARDGGLAGGMLTVSHRFRSGLLKGPGILVDKKPLAEAGGLRVESETVSHAASGVLLQLVVLALVLLPAAAHAADADPVLERCLVSLMEEAKVPARESGVLEELLAREGDVVKQGDVIAKIDDNQPQMEQRKAKAEHDQAVAKAESDVDVRYAVAAEKVAQIEFEKAAESDRKVPGSVTRVELNRLQLNEQKSELQIEQAQLEKKVSTLAAISKAVEVDAAENAIERRLIKSPLDGVVVQMFPHQGEWMQPGDPLARVVRADKLRVEAYVDSTRWNPEQVRDRPVTAEVVLADNRREQFKGRIVFTSPIVESGGDYRVFAEVENRQIEGTQQWLLRAGQTATLTIHSKEPPLPAVRK
jgi:multidrug efflux pump subunit AcrA (membrane-fusion protein)